MSSRQLRKLRQLQQTPQPELAAEESDEDGADVGFHPKRPQASLFAALGSQGDDDDNDDDDDDDDGNGDAQDAAEDEVQAGDAVVSSPIQPAPSKRNKNRKKKKKKAKKTDEDSDAPAATTATAKGRTSDDEIDRALKELKMDEAKRAPSSGTEAHDPLQSFSDPKMDELVGINPYHLRPSNEMKLMFGREIVHSAIAQEEAESEATRRALGRRRGVHEVDVETFLKAGPGEPRLPEISLKKNVFVLGKEHWPRASAGGLTMKTVAQHGEYTEYTFAHDDQYEGTQAGFFHFVMIGDPIRLIHLVKQEPYHVSTLLQASNIAKGDGNAPLAAELCERALFSFGRMTTSGFRRDLEASKARLDFNRPENRQFWLAGYMYLRSLIKKGTYRTALEWAKLLFALDRRDPYVMRLFIHTLAVRAGEAAWFVDFVDADHRKHEPSHAYMAQTKPIAQLLLGDVEGAKETMREHMQGMPWLYAALFQALQLDLPPSIWGAQPPGDHALWTDFYIHLSKDLWNGQPRAVSLLKEVAATIPKQTVDESAGPLGAATLDLARVVFLENQPSLLSHVPRHFLSMEPNFEFDPLPPEEAHNIFSSEASRLPWRHARAQREAREQHPLPPNMAGVEDVQAQDRLWRQFLEAEGRRLVAQRGVIGDEELDELEAEFMRNEEPWERGEDEDDDGGEGGGQGEGEDRQAERMQWIGLQAWIVRQLGPWVARQAEDGGDGGGGQAEGEGEGGQERGERETVALAPASQERGAGEDAMQRAFRRATMPGAWPTVDTDSEDEDG